MVVGALGILLFGRDDAGAPGVVEFRTIIRDDYQAGTPKRRILILEDEADLARLRALFVDGELDGLSFDFEGEIWVALIARFEDGSGRIDEVTIDAGSGILRVSGKGRSRFAGEGVNADPLHLIAIARESLASTGMPHRWQAVHEGEVVAATVRCGELWMPELVIAPDGSTIYRSVAAGSFRSDDVGSSMAVAGDLSAGSAMVRALSGGSAVLHPATVDFERELLLGVAYRVGTGTNGPPIGEISATPGGVVLKLEGERGDPGSGVVIFQIVAVGRDFLANADTTRWDLIDTWDHRSGLTLDSPP